MVLSQRYMYGLRSSVEVPRNIAWVRTYDGLEALAVWPGEWNGKHDL